MDGDSRIADVLADRIWWNGPEHMAFAAALRIDNTPLTYADAMEYVDDFIAQFRLRHSDDTEEELTRHLVWELVSRSMGMMRQLVYEQEA